MATKIFRGQEATISLKDSSDTDIPIGIIDDPEIAVEHEVSELRGAGSTKWQDIQKTATNVTVSGELMSYEIDAWDKLVDYVGTTTGLDPSADVATFTVTMTYTNTDGNDKVIKAKETYFDSTPLGGARDEWIGISLDGTAKDIEITNP